MPAYIFVAIYLSFSTLFLGWMIIRFILIRNNKAFNKQSAFKNFFYELDEYEYTKPIINFPASMLISIQAILALVLLLIFFINILS